MVTDVHLSKIEVAMLLKQCALICNVILIVPVLSTAALYRVHGFSPR